MTSVQWLEATKLFFFFNDTATTEIYTLSLHDALPISPHEDPRHRLVRSDRYERRPPARPGRARGIWRRQDPKSTPLESRHSPNSDAALCFSKKKIYIFFDASQRSTVRSRYQMTTDAYI